MIFEESALFVGCIVNLSRAILYFMQRSIPAPYFEHLQEPASYSQALLKRTGRVLIPVDNAYILH